LNLKRIAQFVPDATLDRIVETRDRISGPIEKVFASHIEREVLSHPRPRAIGIIMDGNRRWARAHGMDPWIGHRFGKEKVREMLRWCKRFGIRGLMLYAFSAENFNRPEPEVAEIMKLMRSGFRELATDPMLQREGIRVRIIGRTHLLPDDVQSAIAHLEEVASFVKVLGSYPAGMEVTGTIQARNE